MPWEQVGHEIRHRVRDPEDFEEGSFRTKPVEGVKGEGITPLMAQNVYMVLGRLKPDVAERLGRTPGTMAVQSIRFRTEVQRDGEWVPTGWTLEKAQAWWAEHGAGFERAAPWPDVELRSFEVRAEGEGDGTTLVGYAIRWGEASQPLPFIERFVKGAFTKSLASGADILALVDHDRSKVLGRRSNGTLELVEDEVGLRVVIRPNLDTTWGRDTLAAVRRGDLRQMSVGFVALRDEWSGNERRVLEAELKEVSVVSMPAYVGTTVSVRSQEGVTAMEQTKVAVQDQEPQAPENRANGAPETRIDPTLSTPAPETRSAFAAYLRGQPYDVRALSVGTAAAGGVLAPDGFVAELIRALTEQSVMRRIARVMGPISQASVRIPRNLTGVAAAWVGENQAITPSDPTFDQVEFTPYKLGALTLVSNELLADSAVNVEQLLATLFGEAFAQVEDAAFFAGDGVGKPSGILNDPNIPTVTAASASAIGMDDLLALYDAVPPQYRASAVWVLHPATMGQLRKLKDATGRYLLVEGLAGATPTTLLGRPVYLSTNMPTIAAGAKVVLFGDVSRAYLIVDRAGVEVQRSADRYFEQDQTAFRATKRVDGKVVLPDAVRFLKMAAA